MREKITIRKSIGLKIQNPAASWTFHKEVETAQHIERMKPEETEGGGGHPRRKRN